MAVPEYHGRTLFHMWVGLGPGEFGDKVPGVDLPPGAWVCQQLPAVVLVGIATSNQVGLAQAKEGETKDGLAAPGEKPGKNSSEPKDLRKPEGSDKNYTAAMTKEKEQKNQKASAQAVPTSWLKPEEGNTVHFHAIIPKHVTFNPELHTVFIRGGEELGQPEWSDACKMYYVEDLHEHGSLMEGSIVIPRQSLDRVTPYKYVLRHDQDSDCAVEYEYIYEQPQKAGEHVNRCLYEKSSLLCSGDWHQYDDIICTKPPGTFQKFQNFFTNNIKKELVKGKKIAAEIMLGHIFSNLQTWNLVNLQKFFTYFRQFYSVVQVPMIYEGKAQPWHSLALAEEEVSGFPRSPAALVWLHEAVGRITKRLRFYEIPALSAEIICRVIGLRSLEEVAEDSGAAARKGSLEDVFQSVLATTRSWLRRVLAKSMLRKGSTVLFTYPEEIQVWWRLMGIDFSAEHGWKESLLGDMEGRLKQERPFSQISAFCSPQWDADGFKDSVARSFEKCVIEAVSSACQVTNLFLRNMLGFIAAC
ncbi:E3 ubiquitin-protein ligase RNF213-like [Callospermophilus lateralis]|uniref:E3 ubiquitin-protein ligase RNF213-like n=1 Tax=Callospermophilus lateralis TaxID=76772 RepID=UPI004038EDC5